ncbi:MAG: DUF2179 domain-containing protein [Bacteroidetes bacterium]|nr:DUF2179 domain-containing protein [Bacteroidota bacterium]
MENIAFFDTFWWSWVVLPLLIFFARIIDQSVGTLRLIFVSKGYKKIAPILGFFEVIIWLIAIAQIMKHLDNPLCYIAYGGGFAMGNYIGILIEEKLSIGNVILRVIPKKDTSDLISHLRESGFGVTSVKAEGAKGEVDIVFTIIKRKDIAMAIEIINRFNPNAFYTIEEVKAVKEGYFGIKQSRKGNYWMPFLKKTK